MARVTKGGIEITRERMEKYCKIIERAKKDNLILSDEQKASVLMDIESADIEYNLQLDDWLNGDDIDFYHDFYGIIREIDRSTFPGKFNFFVPRYAG